MSSKIFDQVHDNVHTFSQHAVWKVCCLGMKNVFCLVTLCRHVYETTQKGPFCTGPDEGHCFL